MAVSTNWLSFVLGVPHYIRALLLGVENRAPHFCKLPSGCKHQSEQAPDLRNNTTLKDSRTHKMVYCPYTKLEL